MKTTSRFTHLMLTGFTFVFLSLQSATAQKSTLPTLAVLELRNEYPNPKLSQGSFSDLLRSELEKTGRFQVLDRYDMDFMLTQQKVEYFNCLSRFCLEEVSSKINVDKLVVGSIKLINKRITVSIRVFDTKTKQFELSRTSDFLDIPEEMGAMVHTTVNDMFGLPNDQAFVTKLTLKNDFESSINTPNEVCLRSDGPRMGFITYFLEPKTAATLKRSKSQGGYEAFPLLFQFGYQFEKQYLNEGNFQALVEFLPMITGLDQGLFIPSVTLMNGIRNNNSGWEFAFGPMVSISRKARGYVDNNNNWVLLNSKPEPEGAIVETRTDSRGNPTITTGFVVAAGKTFKSGKLNIPVNGYLVPSANGVLLGVSFGFNARSRFK
jgi:TolB-like protein